MHQSKNQSVVGARLMRRSLMAARDIAEKATRGVDERPASTAHVKHAQNADYHKPDRFRHFLLSGRAKQ